MLGGVSAVVEFAVLALNVQQIVLCGHTDCGAMKGLAAGGAASVEMPTVHAWLRNAEAARSVLGAAESALDADAIDDTDPEQWLSAAHLRANVFVLTFAASGALAFQVRDGATPVVTMPWVFAVDLPAALDELSHLARGAALEQFSRGKPDDPLVAAVSQQVAWNLAGIFFGTGRA